MLNSVNLVFASGFEQALVRPPTPALNYSAVNLWGSSQLNRALLKSCSLSHPSDGDPQHVLKTAIQPPMFLFLCL